MNKTRLPGESRDPFIRWQSGSQMGPGFRREDGFFGEGFH